MPDVVSGMRSPCLADLLGDLAAALDADRFDPSVGAPRLRPTRDSTRSEADEQSNGAAAVWSRASALESPDRLKVRVVETCWGSDQYHWSVVAHWPELPVVPHFYRVFILGVAP